MRQKILVALVGLFLNSCGSWLTNPEEMSQRSSIPNTGDLNGSGADSGKKKTASETEKEKEADTEKGIALYEKNCASCHQSLVQSNVLDRTSEEIKNAIRDKKAMQGLSFLTGVEIDLIASVLHVPKDPAPPTDGNGKPLELDGLKLYASNCALCHGHFQDSDIRGRVYEAINFAIDNQPEMKNTRFLNEDQRKALESVLKVDNGGGGQPPIDDTTRGAMLYASYCYESCHGPLESSQKRGRGESAISSAIGSVADMKFLSFLTKDEIDLIAKVLSKSSNKVVEARGRLGNRFTIKSKFLNVFKPAASSSSTFAVNNVNSFIFNKVSAFGGPCSRYDANCPGGENSAEVKMSAAVDPLANPMRRGYIENFCRKMLASNVGVDSFVTNIGSVTSTSPKQVDIEKVVHAFKPGYDIPSSVTNTLNVLLESAKSKGYSPKDQWRFLILPVCSSIAVEVL